MFIRNKTASKAGKVLIVNSDPEISRILEVNLTHANLEVLISHSGADALNIIRREKSDIIILDQDLFDIENIEIFRTLKNVSPGIPLIIIGSRLKHKMIPASDEITISYIDKPFDPKEVITLIQRYLAYKERAIVNPLTGLRKPLYIDEAGLPSKWHRGLQAVDSLQMAMEINRKEARNALKNVQRIVASFVKTVPPELQDTFNQLTCEVQEMAVLCNRSLYVAVDFSRRLEIQEDRLLQQESEQVNTSEAILDICRNLMWSIRVSSLFNLKNSKRIVKYALAIADEMKVPDTERDALCHAALFKDLALAFSRTDDIAQIASIDREEAARLKGGLNFLWKTLANISYLFPACNLLIYKNERYDGTGGNFGLKGNNIPLGSRILAIAEALDNLTSARFRGDKKSTSLAMQEIVTESGLSFDPHVVGALLMLVKRNELEFLTTENTAEIDSGVHPG